MCAVHTSDFTSCVLYTLEIVPANATSAPCTLRTMKLVTGFHSLIYLHYYIMYPTHLVVNSSDIEHILVYSIHYTVIFLCFLYGVQKAVLNTVPCTQDNRSPVVRSHPLIQGHCAVRRDMCCILYSGQSF